MRLPLALALLLAALPLAHGLHVESTPLGPPADILGEHQELQREWTVFASESVSELQLRVPGAVFVDVEAGPTSTLAVVSSGEGSGSEGSGSSNDSTVFPPLPVDDERLVARVVVTGSSMELMGSVDITASESKGVQLKLKADKSPGHLLTQVFVSDRRILEQLTIDAPADVVVGADVLPETFNTKPVTIKASGVGNTSLFLDDELVALGALDISATYSADVQVAARGHLTIASALDLASFGSGSIAVLAESVEVPRVVSTIGGSGDVFIQTSAEQDGLVAQSIDMRVGGSGTTTLSKSGRCKQQSVVLLGSGDIEAGSIVSERTEVTLIGSGDVVVQATEYLHATVFASGSVRYVNGRPAKVVERGFFFGSPKVIPADGSTYRKYAARSEPPREATHVGVVGPELFATSLSVMAPSSGQRMLTGMLVLGLCGSVVAGVVAIAMVVHLVVRQRQRRFQYTRLG